MKFSNTVVEILTKSIREKSLRSPLSFWGDGGIIPFEPFFHAFPEGLEKAAINRIFLILPLRKEEVEIHFPFHKDQEIGSNHKKNAWNFDILITEILVVQNYYPTSR